MRNFTELSEREILALAISNEEEDSRIYADFADGLAENYPSSAKVFAEMAGEENEHRRRLIDLFVSKFGEHIPLVRRHEIRGYIPQKPVWQMHPLRIDTVRERARDTRRADQDGGTHLANHFRQADNLLAVAFTVLGFPVPDFGGWAGVGGLIIA